MFKHRQIALAISLGVLCTHSLAQGFDAAEEDLGLLYGSDEMISIATGTQKPIHLAPAVASVITAADIKAMGATTLDEALELIPGLHVTVSGVNRLNTLYSIRGLHSGTNAQVLLTINGIPLRDTYTGSRPNTFRLPVANISRIEVIRGPGSAVHGADAFAGVINVITKDADQINGVQIGARTGSFNSRESWIQYGELVDEWALTFSLEHAISEGDKGRKVPSDYASVLPAPFFASSFAPDVPLQTRYNILNSRLGLANDRWDISLWTWLQRDGGTGSGMMQAIDPVGGTEVEYVQLDVNYHFPEKLSGWEISTRLNLQYENEKNKYMLLPPGSIVPVGDDGNIGTPPNSGCPGFCRVNFTDGLYGNPGAKYNNNSFELNAFSKEYQGHRLRMALGVTQQGLTATETKNFGPGTPAAQVGETAPDPVSGIWLIPGTLTDVTGTPNAFVPEQHRSSIYLSLQDEWQFGHDWELVGGIRYDRYSDFGATTNPRLALIWAMDYNLTSKLLFGSAFRAPSFGEEFATNNPAFQGNAKLRPEKINTVELAFDHRPTLDLDQTLNLYYYKAEDLIDDAPVPAIGDQMQNLNRQKGYGAEAEAKWRLFDTLQLHAAFAWQHSENMQTGNPIADAPSMQTSASLLWKLRPSWSIFGSAVWVGDRERASGDMRNNVGDYTLVNVTLRRQMGMNAEIAASIRNVFDENALVPSDPRVPGDYPLEGRSFYAEFRYHLFK